MGIDSTPGPDDLDPEGRDNAPPWFLVLVVVIIGMGGVLILYTFFYSAGTL